MVDIVDRVQATPNRIKLTAVTGSENTYDVEKVGTVTAEGTDINRSLLMAMQGFEAKTTTFNSDGTITETNGLGQTKKTIFNSDGTITEEFQGEKKIIKTTTFNSDGSVSEVIS
nr:MAG TPA: hypothetical protein [Bacteriophage sp.]